jgi:DNA polymerase
MDRRDAIYLELGLGPIWRRRDASAADAPIVETPAAEAVEADAPKVEDIDFDVAPIVETDDDPPPHVEAPVRRPAPPGTRVPVPAPAPRVAPAPSAGRAVVADPERDARIAALDWTGLRDAVARCDACVLCRTRKNTVFGVGDERAQIMIVGEAPGAEEDARGEPFVGQAGRLLDSMLAAVDMTRESGVFIANVLKCRPPGNRNPEPLEVARCSPHLLRQIALVQPRLVVAMGRFAAQTLLGTEASIASMRGKLHRYGGVPLIVTYHPAYLLRNLPDKAKAWEDLLFIRRTLAQVAGDTAVQG